MHGLKPTSSALRTRSIARSGSCSCRRCTRTFRRCCRCAQFYLHESDLLIWGNKHKELRRLKSRSEQQQGDTLGPFLFCMGIHPFLNARTPRSRTDIHLRSGARCGRRRGIQPHTRRTCRHAPHAIIRRRGKRAASLRLSRQRTRAQRLRLRALCARFHVKSCATSGACLSSVPSSARPTTCLPWRLRWSTTPTSLNLCSTLQLLWWHSHAAKYATAVTSLARCYAPASCPRCRTCAAPSDQISCCAPQRAQTKSLLMRSAPSVFRVSAPPAHRLAAARVRLPTSLASCGLLIPLPATARRPPYSRSAPRHHRTCSASSRTPWRKIYLIAQWLTRSSTA
jgi:hypothetical protein